MMLKQFHIQLTERFKKSQTSNKFIGGLLNILLFVLYPIILLIGLLTILFASIVSLFQKRQTDGKEKFLDKEQTLTVPWSILTQQGNLKIFREFAGDVHFGPTYLHLKSDPVIPILNDEIFGDWFFHFDNMLLLQQWNSTDKPDANLLCIDTLTFDANVWQQNIPSVLWDIVETAPDDLQLTCDTGSEILKYSIKRSQLM
jgi:hypothetical protein